MATPLETAHSAVFRASGSPIPLMPVVLAAVLVVAAVVFWPRPTAALAAEKHAVPPEDEVAAARDRVRTAFKPDYEKSTPAAVSSLAAKLSATAKDEKPGTAAHYALLVEVMELFEKAGDLDRVIDSARTIGADYRAPNLKDALAAALARMLGDKEKAKEFATVAGRELESPTTATDRAAVGSEWLAVTNHGRAEARGRADHRARRHLLDALAATDVKGLMRVEVEKLLQQAEAEIEAVDAKVGKFSLYAGKWTIKYENGYTHEYVVAADGALTFDRAIGPDGKPFFKKEESKAKLARRDGAVVVSYAQGKVMERFELRTDKLVVERFDPAKLYPKNPNHKGDGVRVPSK